MLWRRTSPERLLGDDGRPNRLGTALLPGLRTGVLHVVNPFGSGVADDKRLHPRVDDLVRCTSARSRCCRRCRPTT